jgi:predicted negative regulator of RcsB-dependent stress response
MKLALASVIVVVQLTVAQTFNWRLYNNGGCNENSSAAQTFPPFPAGP